MNYLILGKVVGGHVVVLIGLLINHFIKNHDNSFAQKSKPIPMRVVTTAPPPAPPVATPKPPPPVKPKPPVKKPDPVVVQKPKPKPPVKPKPAVEKPKPKEVVKKPKKPAVKPKPKPPVREPDPPPVPIAQKTPTPEELMAQLQALAPKPPKPVTNVQKPQPPQPPRPITPNRPQVRKVVPPNASQLHALQNRVEQECLARSWSINKPNRIIQNLTAIAVARVHRAGDVRFAGFKLRSGDARMDEAVRITIDRAGCRFPLPANAPDFIDLSIEFELNP